MFSFLQEIANETANMSASELEQLLAYHVVPQALTASDLQDERTFTTADNGSTLLIKEYHSVHYFISNSLEMIGILCWTGRRFSLNSGVWLNTIARRLDACMIAVCAHVAAEVRSFSQSQIFYHLYAVGVEWSFSYRNLVAFRDTCS